MPFLINIGVIKANGMMSNANIQVGATVHNSHTANSKWLGVVEINGDLSPSLVLTGSGMLDTDVSDQGQIGNPSLPMSTQV
ncbi:spore germination protein [Paenibacillus chartarius]|uniref:Spore germination protein n=1 Tax=Paenibacillus chartarius TaxID=747481 RepID=A0ABV6DG92_9BACL